ncbi:hypothetical protein C8250_026220 [Streptomyces sp. So13.3]|uniref:hypothetical protein n=1 Tax=Streptomyces TaxID=1883 RepID=UPI00164E1FFD|nr:MULTISPECIES: hypothetical protein [Streptomyces]MCZ4099603.1 hypothetical protein [Streptomyces sp. H39-C1]QNA74924.1 hypothetical protein C8250_026220 [Streptomyces sp. So13.3]
MTTTSTVASTAVTTTSTVASTVTPTAASTVVRAVSAPRSGFARAEPERPEPESHASARSP